MISIDEQQTLFLNISRKLKEKITVYAIGGTAMTFLGLKDSTLDIDLVFENKRDRETFKDAIKILGYREFDPVKIYGARRNCPEMLILGTENRFDLFVNDVIDLTFSSGMKERAEQTHQFGDNLILKIADPHDIILMKCATDRQKDKDDARNIINNMSISWKIIVEEAKRQVELGRKKAAFDLGCFLEDLKEQLKVNVPQEVLDEIWNFTNK